MASIWKAVNNRWRLRQLALTIPHAARAIRRVHQERLTYLDIGALIDLYRAMQEMERRAIPGKVIEAGCAMGGSALILAKAKSSNRSFYIYDTFGMIPPPSAQDGEDAQARYQQIAAGTSEGIRGDLYYGYRTGLWQEVNDNFVRYGFDLAADKIHLVQGLFQDTLVVDGPVALAHIDGDWYDSVWVCLERIVPHLVPGGRLIIDDYGDWSGCRRAVDEFFADCRQDFLFSSHARLHIQRH